MEHEAEVKLYTVNTQNFISNLKLLIIVVMPSVIQPVYFSSLILYNFPFIPCTLTIQAFKKIISSANYVSTSGHLHGLFIPSFCELFLREF